MQPAMSKKSKLVPESKTKQEVQFRDLLAETDQWYSVKLEIFW